MLNHLIGQLKALQLAVIFSTFWPWKVCWGETNKNVIPMKYSHIPSVSAWGLWECVNRFYKTISVKWAKPVFTCLSQTKQHKLQTDTLISLSSVLYGLLSQYCFGFIRKKDLETMHCHKIYFAPKWSCQVWDSWGCL